MCKRKVREKESYVLGETVETGVGSLALDRLDAEESVVLGNTLRAARSTSLDDTAAKGDSNVGNGRVLGLARAVRDHDGPVVGLRELSSLDRLADGADLLIARDA